MRIKETGRFQAVDDQGRRYTVVEWSEIVDTGTLDRPDQTETVLRAYKLPNGDHINANADGSLEHVAKGRKLRRV